MYHTNYLYTLLANWNLFLNKTCGISYHTAQHKLLRKMGKGTQTISYWGIGIVLLVTKHIGTLLDYMDWGGGITGDKW